MSDPKAEPKIYHVTVRYHGYALNASGVEVGTPRTVTHAYAVAANGPVLAAARAEQEAMKRTGFRKILSSKSTFICADSPPSGTASITIGKETFTYAQPGNHDNPQVLR